MAVEAGASRIRSSRLFLAFVANKADRAARTASTDDELAAALDVLVGAALAGIKPPSTTGQGGRGAPGKGKRASNGGEIAGRDAKTIGRHIDPYLEAYAEAVLTMAGQCQREPALLRDYLRLCDVSDANIERALEGSVSDGMLVPSGSLNVSAYSLARAVPLAGALRAALETARASCAARGRAFYTSDLLLALIELPGGRVTTCLDDARAGAGAQVRDWLYQSLARLGASNAHPFQPFEWIERPDIRLAQDLALADGTGIVTELHVLLAVLDGSSTTAQGLAQLLDADYAAVRAAVDGARLTLPEVLLTPGPAPELRVTEEPT